MKKPLEFKTKKEFYSYLVKNKSEIIALKKASLKFTDPFELSGKESSVVKSLSTNYKDDPASGVIKRSIICNTFLWMDSQNDVLVPGCCTKTINERSDKILHLHDHEYKITSKVGKPTSIYERQVAWSDLGVDKPGMTTTLIMDSEIMKSYNPMIFDDYLNGNINQHSIGLNYITLELAINDPEEKAYYAVWSKWINQIGNKACVEEDGYFWLVSEIKLIENSCVISGSNELTPTIPNEGKSKPVTTVNPVCEDCGEELDPEGACVNCCNQDKGETLFDVNAIISSMPVKSEKPFDVSKVIKSLNN